MLTRVLLLAVVVNVSAYTGRRKEFCSKAKGIIFPFWSVDELGKIADKVTEDLYNLRSRQECADNIMNYIISATPSSKYPALMTIMKSNDACLEKAGSKSKTMDVLNKAGAIISKKLKKAYKKITTKVKKMKSNKKSENDVFAQCYQISTAILTKKLVQKIVTSSANGLSCVEWECAKQNTNDILSVNKFNTTRTKAC